MRERRRSTRTEHEDSDREQDERSAIRLLLCFRLRGCAVANIVGDRRPCAGARAAASASDRRARSLVARGGPRESSRAARRAPSSASWRSPGRPSAATALVPRGVHGRRARRSRSIVSQHRTERHRRRDQDEHDQHRDRAPPARGSSGASPTGGWYSPARRRIHASSSDHTQPRDRRRTSRSRARRARSSPARSASANITPRDREADDRQRDVQPRATTSRGLSPSAARATWPPSSWPIGIRLIIVTSRPTHAAERHRVELDVDAVAGQPAAEHRELEQRVEDRVALDHVVGRLTARRRDSDRPITSSGIATTSPAIGPGGADVEQRGAVLDRLAHADDRAERAERETGGIGMKYGSDTSTPWRRATM